MYVRALEERTTPTVFTVSNTNDSGAGSLRQAIINANADSNPDADTINASGVIGTITLATALPAISDVNVSIQGSGSASLTVTAGGNFRLFATSGTGALHNVSISGMKLTGGNLVNVTGTPGNGGAIFVANANLTLTDVQIVASKTDRAGGAIAVDNAGNGTPKTITLNNCLISGCTATGTNTEATFVKGMGGAFYFGDSGILNINNSTITGNSAAKWGGAGYMFAGSSGSWNITGSTISGNISDWSGGAFLMYGPGAQTMTCLNSLISGNIAKGTSPDYLYGAGGGLVSAPSGGAINHLNVRNCTLTGNSALNGGAIACFYYGAGGKTNASIQNSTIVNNTATQKGGGVFAADNGSAINIDSCIFKNSSPSGNDLNASSINPVTATVSLINDPVGAVTFNPDTFTATHVGVDAMLGPLANNGGPTQSFLPQAGSSAIDNGSNPSFLTTDQRGTGYVRSYNAGLTDIGSIEVQPFGVPSVAPISLPNVVGAGGTSYSLVVVFTDDQQIVVSSLQTGNVTITGPNSFSVNPTFVSVDINSDGTPRQATYSFTPPGGSWDGPEAGTYALSMNSNQVHDNVGNFVQPGPIGQFIVIISRVFVVNATNDEATDTDGKLSLREAVLAADINSPTSDTITFDPTVFAGAQTITLNGASFGAMNLTDDLTITGPGSSKLTVNAAQSSGHFQLNAGISLTMNGLSLTNGNATGGGSIAINVSGVSLNLAGCVFASNKSNGHGGAIYQGAFGGKLAVINIASCSFSNNTATGWGGAIMMDADTSNGVANITSGNQLTITDSTIDGNSCNGDGGGIFIRMSKGSMTMDRCTISHNTATAFGGGINFHSSKSGTATLRNSTFYGNVSSTAGNTGSAFCMSTGFDGSIIIQNCTLTDGSAASGGAISRSSGSGKVSLESTIVYGNTAGSGNPDFAGGDISAKNCIIFSTAGASSFTDLGGNLFGAAADPQLFPLQNNGGPTLTCAIPSNSTARDHGSNPANLAYDQRGNGFNRVVGFVADIGAFEINFGPPPPTVIAVAINGANGGGNQRSMVESIVVSFDQPVAFATGAFQLARTALASNGSGPLGNVSLTIAETSPSSTVTLKFAAGGTVGVDLANSLLDGLYQLTIFSSGITGYSGFNMTSDYQTPTSGANRIIRLYGDSDGNGVVDGIDFGAFRTAFNTNSFAFDKDGNGVVDGLDFGQFRSNFNAIVL